jgi:hypothetical protein
VSRAKRRHRNGHLDELRQGLTVCEKEVDMRGDTQGFCGETITQRTAALEESRRLKRWKTSRGLVAVARQRPSLM